MGSTIFVDRETRRAEELRTNSSLDEQETEDALREALSGAPRSRMPEQGDRILRTVCPAQSNDGRSGATLTRFHPVWSPTKIDFSNSLTGVHRQLTLSTPTRGEVPAAGNFSKEVLGLIDDIVERLLPWDRDSCKEMIQKYIHRESAGVQMASVGRLKHFVATKQAEARYNQVSVWLQEDGVAHHQQERLNNAIQKARSNRAFEAPFRQVFGMLSASESATMGFMNRFVNAGSIQSPVYARVFAHGDADSVKSIEELRDIAVTAQADGGSISDAIMAWRRDSAGHGSALFTDQAGIPSRPPASAAPGVAEAANTGKSLGELIDEIVKGFPVEKERGTRYAITGYLAAHHGEDSSELLKALTNRVTFSEKAEGPNHVLQGVGGAINLVRLALRK